MTDNNAWTIAVDRRTENLSGSKHRPIDRSLVQEEISDHLVFRIECQHPQVFLAEKFHK